MIGLALAGLALSGCQMLQEVVSQPPIPRELAEEVAPDLSALGHPNGTFQEVRLASWSAGAAEEHRRWVDLEIHYTRRQREAPYTMVVRLYHERVQPCRISIDVLSDDGPDPLLLDNGIASAAIGAALCDALDERAQATPR